MQEVEFRKKSNPAEQSESFCKSSDEQQNGNEEVACVVLLMFSIELLKDSHGGGGNLMPVNLVAGFNKVKTCQCILWLLGHSSSTVHSLCVLFCFCFFETYRMHM